MMKEIKLRFTAQLKDVAGVGTDMLIINEQTGLKDVLLQIAGQYGKEFTSILFDEDNNYRNSNLIVVNQTQVNFDDDIILNQGDEITLMSPISGG